MTNHDIPSVFNCMGKRRHCIWTLLLWGLSVVLVDGALRVVGTTTQVADMVRDIGGERVDVESLMGPSVDPHLYKATASDVQRIHRADIIFYNGLHLEGRMTGVLERLSAKKRVVAVSKEISRERLLSPEEYEESYDPHIWFDLEIWKDCGARVRDSLIEADEEGEKIYRTRYAAFEQKLDELTEWAKGRVARIPESKRILVTSHDAYNYFGRYFGFKVYGVQGISTVTEAGLADMMRMVDFIKEQEIPSIFVESSVSRAAIERISRDSGAEIGGELYSDAMGPKGETRSGLEGERYEVSRFTGMLKYNIDTIVKGLTKEVE